MDRCYWKSSELVDQVPTYSLTSLVFTSLVYPGLSIEFKFRVSTYNIRALTYNIKEFL